MDLKKEIKRRFDKEYKYFNITVKKSIYDVNEKKPFGFVLGYMKVIWNEEHKRLEPILKNYDKVKLWEKMETASKEIYKKPFKELDEKEKKNIRQLAKEEMKDEYVEIIQEGEKTKIIRGKKEIKFSVPVPMYCLKICSSGRLNKILAILLGYGASYFIFNSEQIVIENDKITLTANYQRKIFNDQFIFSKAGKNIIQDIGFGVERENVLQETANQIPRTIFFDTEASKKITEMREVAKINAERYKAQKEGMEN